MNSAISMTTTQALKWALQRISTSLDEGEYFARAKEALDNAERVEAEKAANPHMVLPLTIIRDDNMGYFYATIENMPMLALASTDVADLLAIVGQEVNDILSSELRPNNAPLIPAGWRLPSGWLVADREPPLGEYDEHLRPLCRQLFTQRANPTEAEILAAHATRKIKGARA